MEKIDIFSKLVNIIKEPFVRWAIAFVAFVLFVVDYFLGPDNIISRYFSERVKAEWGWLFIIISLLAIFAIFFIDVPKFFSAIIVKKRKKDVANNYANLSENEKQQLIDIYDLPEHSATLYGNPIITELCDLGMLENPDGLFLGVWTEKGVKCFYEVSEQAKKLIREEKREENRGKKHGKRRW